MHALLAQHVGIPPSLPLSLCMLSARACASATQQPDSTAILSCLETLLVHLEEAELHGAEDIVRGVQSATALFFPELDPFTHLKLSAAPASTGATRAALASAASNRHEMMAVAVGEAEAGVHDEDVGGNMDAGDGLDEEEGDDLDDEDAPPMNRWQRRRGDAAAAPVPAPAEPTAYAGQAKGLLSGLSLQCFGIGACCSRVLARGAASASRSSVSEHVPFGQRFLIFLDGVHDAATSLNSYDRFAVTSTSALLHVYWRRDGSAASVADAECNSSAYDRWTCPARALVLPVLSASSPTLTGIAAVTPLAVMSIRDDALVRVPPALPVTCCMLTQFDVRAEGHSARLRHLARYVTEGSKGPSLLIPVDNLEDASAVDALREPLHDMRRAYASTREAGSGQKSGCVLAVPRAVEHVLNSLEGVLAGPPMMPSSPELGSCSPDAAGMTASESYNALQALARVLNNSDSGMPSVNDASVLNAASWHMTLREKTCESSHPLTTASPSTQSWRVIQPDAWMLRIVWDARTSLPPGTRITIQEGRAAARDIPSLVALKKSELLSCNVVRLTVTMPEPAAAWMTAGTVYWGVSVRIIPVGTAPPLPLRLQDLTNNAAQVLAVRQSFCATDWSVAAMGFNVDAILVSAASRAVVSHGACLLLGDGDEEAIVRAADASMVPPSLLRERTFLIRMLQDVHARLTVLLRADGNVSSASSLVRDAQVGATLKAFFSAAEDVSRLRSALHATCTHGGMLSISLSRLQSLDETLAREAREDVSKSSCVFAQLYRAVTSNSSAVTVMCNGSIPFGVEYRDELGYDGGGVRRETLSRVIDDLFPSDANADAAFTLMKLTPRAVRDGTHEFVPNAAHSTRTSMAMLQFVGQLMGLSLRAEAGLAFDFAPIVWKTLVGDAMDAGDVAALDPAVANLLRRCRAPGAAATPEGTAVVPLATSEAFNAEMAGVTCTVVLPGGTTPVPVLSHGYPVPLTWENRLAFADAVDRLYFTHLSRHLRALRDGFGSIVPLSAVSPLPWNVLQRLVCGSADVSVDDLREFSVYDTPYSSTHAVIVRYWRVLAGFSPDERSGWLRFIWGRSRLPSRAAMRHTRFHVSMGNAGAGVLPNAATCFGHLYLPPYETDEIMARQLRIAIQFGSRSMGRM